ncbi:MAG: adenylate/guanylate cyclase domain-containing protein [Armatimonadetes bacterium]|nr:adenylate/guanylate cyclase domain-containing protein [Armatimonadota bacterium]
MRQRKVVLFLVGLALLLLFGGVPIPILDPFLSGIERTVYDQRVRSLPPRAVSDKVSIVAIDAKSVQELGRLPWHRGIHARMIKVLKQAGARVIGFDIIFCDKVPPSENAALEKAAREAGNVISVITRGRSERKLCLLPPSLEAAFAGFGSSVMIADQDGVIRRVPLMAGYDEQKGVPAFSLMVTGLYETPEVRFEKEPGFVWWKDSRVNMEGLRFNPVRKGNVLRWNEHEVPVLPSTDASETLIPFWRAREGDFVPRYSFVEVLNGKAPRDAFRDRAVIVCATEDVNDTFMTPLSKGATFESKMPGGEVHAYCVSALLEGRSFFWERLHDSPHVLFLLTFLTCLFLLWLSGWQRLASVSSLGILFLGWALWRQSEFHFVEIVRPLALLIMLSAISAAYESKRLRKVLGQLVPRGVAEKLQTQEASLGGKEIKATILFSDIRGYTTISETVSPQILMELLNEYYGAMHAAVEKYKGEVCSHLGDGLLVMFADNREFSRRVKDHPAAAVKAGLEMLTGLKKLQEKWKKESKPAVDIGVGICTGPVAWGWVGAAQRRQPTPIGDTVNVASRLQGISAEVGTPVILHETTYEEVKEEIPCKYIKSVSLKGKTGEVKAFGVAALIGLETMQNRSKEPGNGQ